MVKFKPTVHAAYPPSQAATAEDGTTPVVLLFLPQWQQVLSQVRTAGGGRAQTQWGYSREADMPVWFVRWQTGHEIAVTFPLKGAGELLAWWQEQERVDVLLLLEPLDESRNLPVDGLDLEHHPWLADEQARAVTPHVRVRGVAFLTVDDEPGD